MHKRPRLYELLPEFVRYDDTKNGRVLEALADSLDTELDRAWASVEQLENNWFVETCEPSVLPLLGSLVDAPSAQGFGTIPTLRALIADTIVNRRLQGTLGTLARELWAASGWGCAVIEGVDLVMLLPTLHDPSARMRVVPDLRHKDPVPMASQLSLRSRTPDIRSRPQTLEELQRGPARAVTPDSPRALCICFWHHSGTWSELAEPFPLGAGRYQLHPFGVDTPLFGAAQADEDSGLALSPGLKTPQTVRSASSGEPAPGGVSALAEGFPLRIFFCGINSDSFVELGSEQIGVTSLRDWPTIDGSGYRALIDPSLGRLRIDKAERVRVTAVRVASHGVPEYDSYKGPAGKPCSNRDAGSSSGDEFGWRALVTKDLDISGTVWDGVYPTPGDAVGAWQEWRQKASPDTSDQRGLIEIEDNARYTLGENLRINLGDQGSLVIRAADGATPTIIGNLGVHGTGESSLRLDRLGIYGYLGVFANVSVDITGCTLLNEGRRSRCLYVGGTRDPSMIGPRVRATGCILGGIYVRDSLAQLTLTGCVINGGDKTWLRSNSVNLVIRTCTCIGPAEPTMINLLEDSIVTGLLKLKRTDTGSVKRSWVPRGSQIPRSCDHDLILEEDHPPRFVSTRFGDPGYGRLHEQCPPAFLNASACGDEIGAFKGTGRLVRQENVANVLRRTISAGISVSLHDVT